jgi:hypothetical protein
MPFSVQRIIGRALLSGCILPTGAGILVLFMLLRFATRAGLPAIAAMVMAVVGAWFTSNTVRRMLRRKPGGEGWKDRLTIAWASEEPSTDPSPIRPTATALDTWGGFFYLLRDIAFFAGIDRPKGAFALYIEAWSVGPPALVSYMNNVASGTSSADPLFDAAKSLVELRERLIDEHLQQQAISPRNVVGEVRTILKPMVQT